MSAATCCSVLDRHRSPAADRAESAPGAGPRATDGASASALRALADTELRLDQVIAAAREAAATAVTDARRRAEAAAVAVAGEIARARGEIAAEIAASIAASLAEKPELRTTAVLMIAIPETMVVLGFVVSVLILLRGG